MKKKIIKKVGIMGGDTTYDLGPLKDVVLFFDCLSYFVVDRFKMKDWGLLSDRLYRRYLRIDELKPASELMDNVRSIFSGLSSGEVDWGDGIQGDMEKTWLDASQENLAMVFKRHFDRFDKAKESALYEYESYGNYYPVRLTASNFPCFAMEEMRPLSQYEELGAEDEPFWLMPESMAYKFLEEKK